MFKKAKAALDADKWNYDNGDGDGPANDFVPMEVKLNCPECGHLAGQMKWTGVQCSCGTWVTPGLQFAKSKVDMVVPLSREQFAPVVHPTMATGSARAVAGDSVSEGTGVGVSAGGVGVGVGVSVGVGAAAGSGADTVSSALLTTVSTVAATDTVLHGLSPTVDDSMREPLVM